MREKHLSWLLGVLLLILVSLATILLSWTLAFVWLVCSFLLVLSLTSLLWRLLTRCLSILSALTFGLVLDTL